MDIIKTQRINFTPEYDEDFKENFDDYFGCDICEKTLNFNKDTWYHRNDNDICTECANKSLDDCSDYITAMDRIDFSEKDKPRVWPCVQCKTLLGGGCKWNLLWDDVDLCMSCFSSTKTLVDILTNNFQYIPMDNEHYFVSRMDLLVLDISNVRNHTFSVPPEISSHITEKRNKEFTNLFMEFVSYDIKGSILKWTLFTDIANVDFYPADTGLVIKCEHPYPIVSLCVDDHGRIGLNVIYETYDEYKRDLDSWIGLSGDELKVQTEKNKEILRKGSLSDEDCQKGAKSFSEYIRFKKDLPFYYG